MILHLVLFNPKSELEEAERRSFALEIQAAVREIPGIQRAIVGRSFNLNPGYARSLGDKTYEFVALLEFADQSALLAYLSDPRHRVLGRRFWELCDSTVITEVDAVDAQIAEVGDLLVR